MSEDYEWRAIGERLRRTRLIAGMSQAELGKKVGLDRTMVAKIEAGTRRIGALELTQPGPEQRFLQNRLADLSTPPELDG